MPDFAAIVRDFVDTATSLEVLLSAVGAFALVAAGVGWIMRLGRREERKPSRGKRGYGYRPRSAAAAAAQNWGIENGIVFPAGGEFVRPQVPVDLRSFDDERERGPLFGGSDVLAGGGRVADAVRDRPLEFLAGALAAGFAAGLIVPLFANQNRVLRLLERIANGKDDARLQAQREAERFRQARAK